MGLFRRDKPLHERLAEEGGLDFPRDVHELDFPTEPVSRKHPFWQVAGIHGVPRAREWDAVASAEAPGLPGEEVSFVALEDGTLVVDEDLPDDVLGPLADALDGSIEPPYRAVARRQGEDVWSVGAFRVDVVEVPEDVPGDQVDLVVRDGERTLLVDEARSTQHITSLEAFAAERFGSFVLQASRLDERLWEVTVNPL